MDGIVSLLISIFGKLIAEEVKDWLPAIASCITSRAVGILPEEMRERYSEEWCSHMDDVPGRLAKIFTALGFALAALKVSHPLSRLFSRGIGVLLLLLSAPVAASVWMLSRVYGQYPFKGYENQFVIIRKDHSQLIFDVFLPVNVVFTFFRPEMYMRFKLQSSIPEEVRPLPHMYPYSLYTNEPLILRIVRWTSAEAAVRMIFGLIRGEMELESLVGTGGPDS